MASDIPLEMLSQFLSLASSMGSSIVMQKDDTATQHVRRLSRFTSRNFVKIAVTVWPRFDRMTSHVSPNMVPITLLAEDVALTIFVFGE